MATSGRSALLSSTYTGLKNTLENSNPEEEDGQDLWWATRYLSCSELGFYLVGKDCLWGLLCREDGLTASRLMRLGSISTRLARVLSDTAALSPSLSAGYNQPTRLGSTVL